MPPPPPAPTCYRHPGREAWRTCTRCQRVACTDCLVQASIGSQCVECVKAAKAPATVRVQRTLAAQSHLVTYALMGLNIAVFVWMVVRDPDTLSRSISDAHYNWVLFEPLLRDEPWRLVTSGFAHFGLIHLLFNMLALFNLGPAMELMLGRTKFLLLYVASLLSGALGAIILTSDIGFTAGASGAVFGLFGAYAIAVWKQGINPLRTNIGNVILVNLAITFFVPSISIGVHIGGLVGGGICAVALFPTRWRKPEPWLGYVVPIAVMVLAVALSLALAQTG
jgi:membrane associated rhomboid family serine protease